MIQIIVSNNIRIKDCPVRIRAEITKALTLENPEYLDRVKKKRPLWGVDKHIKCYNIEINGDITCPRGFLSELHNILRSNGIQSHQYDQHNLTVTGDVVGFGKWNDKYQLYPYQESAVHNFVVNNYGVIVAPAGAGKTNIALRCVWELQRSTLWVTHTKDLMYQTKARAELLMSDIGKVGIVGDSSKELGSGKLIIATVQTLQHNPEIVEILKQRVGMVVVDECLVGDTLIVKVDGGFSPITDICNGTDVLGGAVTNQFCREAETVKIFCSHGLIEGSLTHPTFVLNNFRVDPKKKNTFTSNDLTIKTLQDINIGDRLPVLKKIPHTVKHNWTPEQLSFVGLIMADGHIDKHGHRIKVNVTHHQDWYLKIFKLGATSFGETNVKHSKDCRGNLTVWVNSPKLRLTLENVFGVTPGKKADKLVINEQIQYAPLESIKTFIETVYSCEGDLDAKSKSRRINIGMVSKEFIIGLSLLLRKFSILTTYQEIDRKFLNHNVVYRLTCGGSDFNEFMSVFNLSNNKQSKELNTGKSQGYDIGDYRLVKVYKIARTYERKTVYDYTTTSHTFVANGILTHNCHHTPTSTFIDIVSQFPAKHLLGITATPDRKDQLEQLMYLALGPKIAEIDRQQLYDDGVLIKPEVNFIYTDFTYRETGENVDAGGEDLNYRALMSALLTDDARAELIAGNIFNAYRRYGTSIVLAESVRYCFKLQELVHKLFLDRYGIYGIPDMAVVHGGLSRYTWLVAGTEADAKHAVNTGQALEMRKKGKTWQIKVEQYSEKELENWQLTKKQRLEIIEKFKTGEIKILFATQLAREGLDVPHLAVGHLATPMRGDVSKDRTDGAGVEQYIGRVMRADKNNPNKRAAWCDYVDYNVGVFKSQYQSRRRVYQRLGIKLPRKKSDGEDLEKLLSQIKF